MILERRSDVEEIAGKIISKQVATFLKVYIK